MDPSWRVPDALWERIQPLLPVERPKPKGGRPRMPDRQALDAMFYALRTGIQWKALPRELGAASTVHDRFVEWREAKVFHDSWRDALEEYDELQGLDWAWQAMDGAMTKAPLGGKRNRSQSDGSREVRNQAKPVD